MRISRVFLASITLALPIPAPYTISPEPAQQPLAVRGATVVAQLTHVWKRGEPQAYAKLPLGVVVRWRGTAFGYVAPQTGFAEYMPPYALLGGMLADGSLALTRVTPFSGAYTGERYELFTVPPDGEPRRTGVAKTCALGSDFFAEHAGAADGERVAVTLDDRGGIAQIDAAPGSLAPFATLLERSRCRTLGRGVVLALRGAWAGGYRTYDPHGALGDLNINLAQQRFVATRWHGTSAVELGDGVVLAIEPDGRAVGATGPVASNFTVPHAAYWDARGRRTLLVHGDARSAAYDLTADGTVVGMEQTEDGKHYAFVWRNGRAIRLDDLPHPRGWRFEAAFLIGPDRAVYGVGTQDGDPVLFGWRS